MRQIEVDETRAMIMEFSKAFGRPINAQPTTPSVSDRLLLGKLLLEEVLEYITLGLGLTLTLDDHTIYPQQIELVHLEGAKYNVIEAADGLGDVNVIIHFNALWEGINLSAVTNEIHRSNMSKLDELGKPIINYCNLCDGSVIHGIDMCERVDKTKPLGKILKGPNYSPPNLLPILGIVPNEEEE